MHLTPGKKPLHHQGIVKWGLMFKMADIRALYMQKNESVNSIRWWVQNLVGYVNAFECRLFRPKALIKSFRLRTDFNLSALYSVIKHLLHLSP